MCTCIYCCTRSQGHSQLAYGKQCTCTVERANNSGLNSYHVSLLEVIDSAPHTPMWTLVTHRLLQLLDSSLVATSSDSSDDRSPASQCVL